MYGTDGKFLNQNGDYEVTKSGGSGASGRFDVDSWFLKGLTNFETGPLSHNFAVATNGYRWTIYSARNRGEERVLGNSNLYHPVIFNNPHVKKGSGRYKSSSSDMKNISVVDDIKFNDYFSTILSVSRSWFTSYKLDPSKEKNYDKSGFNYGVSLVYKPVENVSLYTTYADSISNEQSTYTFRRGPRAGETLTVEPIRSKQYEIGAKARLGELDLSAAIFEIKRPVAYLVGSGANAQYKIQGTQRNRGFELTTGGKLVDTLSMYGGFTLLDAKIKNAKDGVSEGKTVIGEPKLPPLMSKIFPKIKSNDNKSGMLSSSVETIIASKTQVVFGPIGMMFDENSKAQLESAGIAVVKIDKFQSIKEIQDSFSKIAEIWGKKSVKRAREFNDYFNDNIKFVSQKTANLTPKKRVLVLNYSSGNFNTISSKDIGAEYISVAGGINLSSELSDGDFKISKVINEEQVIIFNPDIIITNSQKSTDAIAKNASFAKLKAVQNGEIFVVPSGVYLWSVRSAEGVLYPLWLAKTFYPEQFSDLNLEQKTKEFYERFYNYKLSDSELKEILHPKGEF